MLAIKNQVSPIGRKPSIDVRERESEKIHRNSVDFQRIEENVLRPQVEETERAPQKKKGDSFFQEHEEERGVAGRGGTPDRVGRIGSYVE